MERHRLADTVYQLAVDRMQEIERLRADLVSLTPAARIARVVLHLAMEIGRPGNDGILVELGIPRDELAVMAAMSRSVAVPLLSQLQGAGILGLGRGRITVRDLGRLRIAATGRVEPDYPVM
ncbi:helix-turn-helix domain-containing protein [Saccharopolyspora elongata]|nr:helix-turn-helix domain-containing protein [Saccharopolyspora elongata]